MNDAEWEAQLRKHLHDMRMQWSADGVLHLMKQRGHFGLLDPELIPPQPTPGYPCAPPNWPDPDPDIIEEWHRVDEDLISLFTSDFLSGSVDEANQVLAELGHAPPGS